MKPGLMSLTVIPYSPRPAASDFVSGHCQLNQADLHLEAIEGRERGDYGLMLPLGRHLHACDLAPHLASLLHFLTVLGRGQSMPARSKVLGNGSIRGEEALCMARRFKPLHPPLPLAGRLV
jgi:hypothetical protein